MRAHLKPLPFLLMLIGGYALAEETEDAKKAEATEVKPNPKLKGYDKEGGEGKRVFEVPVLEEIDLGLASFIERVVKEAQANDVIMLRIKTFGGRVDAAVRIRDALLDSEAPTVGFIDRRAISAGALISLACDTIIMSPGASIGAATPVTQGQDGKMEATSEKVVSYMRAEMRATADAKGRRSDLAEAMVDRTVVIKGVVDKEKLLTLTTDEALKLKLAEDTAEDVDAAIKLLNLGDAERVEKSTDWGEQVARVLTSSTVSGLLMTFGMLGLLMELYTPGFGVAGAIGIVCLSLFFFGQYAANLAGFEELVLFAVGFILLMLEIFVIPGFGIAGIGGIGCMVIALILAMLELEIPWDVSFELGYAQDMVSSAVVRMAIAMMALLIATFIFGRYLPGSGVASFLVYNPAGPPGAEASLGSEAPGGSLPDQYVDLLNQNGTAHTVLRPTGIVEFGKRRVHVVTEGDYIEKGEAVTVILVDGHRVVVKKA